MNGSDYNCDKLLIGSTHGSANPTFAPNRKEVNHLGKYVINYVYPIFI